MPLMKLKGGFTTTDPRLDRLPEWDERNALWPIRELVGWPEVTPRLWRLDARFNQLDRGACVPHGWAHELNAAPVRTAVTQGDIWKWYDRCRQIDEWPGEDYEGTSVLAGAKVMKEIGHIEEYRWALRIEDVMATLSTLGPVVIGVNWYDTMFRTDADGWLNVGGKVAGGHCVCLRGIQRTKNGLWYVVGRQSWGKDWGKRGDFRLSVADLDRLVFQENGEACVPVIRR